MIQIIADQIGYKTGSRKSAVLRGNVPKTFEVKNLQSGKIVYTGSLSEPVKNEHAGEIDYIADFTDVTEPGEYCIQAKGCKPSMPFAIGDHVYDQVTHDLLRFFYLQRCGVEVQEKYAGAFAHPSCHDTPARIHGTNQTLDVRGGWHDAGDYGRYIVAAAVAVADLLLAYENDPAQFEQDLNIPESTLAVPDLLSEVRFELEWMLKMQIPESGEVYHKVTCAGFPDLPVMPEDEREELIICPPSITATADFAAVMAMATRFYMDYDEVFAKRCLRAAIKAYDAMQGMFLPGGFKNPKDIVTGEYCDSSDVDERYWAAAELYKTTGEERYHEDVRRQLKKGMIYGYGWTDVGSFGNAAYLSTRQYPVDEELIKQLEQSIVDYANMLLGYARKDAYGFSLPEYEWGSNMYVANNAYHLYDAYRITGKSEYLEAAREQVHYLFGRNANAVCFVTGSGTVSPENPHHRPSAAKRQAMCGMLVGGPDEGFHDACTQEKLRDAAPARVYIDDLDSYSTNEVTIYWNSAILMALSVV